MKKKLFIFGLAGVLLLSGISVSAATYACGHPSVTISYPTENRNYQKCKVHDRCEVHDLYGLKVMECHNCFISKILEETKLKTVHTPSDKYE